MSLKSRERGNRSVNAGLTVPTDPSTRPARETEFPGVLSTDATRSGNTGTSNRVWPPGGKSGELGLGFTDSGKRLYCYNENDYRLGSQWLWTRKYKVSSWFWAFRPPNWRQWFNVHGADPDLIQLNWHSTHRCSRASDWMPYSG